MDISAPGGFLGAFVLTGILLPIVASFVLDGVVSAVRGHGFRGLLISSALTIGIIVISGVAWQNGANTAPAAGVTDSMDGAIGLILVFSITGAALGFGLRMLSLLLNPARKALDAADLRARAARRESRAKSVEARKHVPQSA